VRIAIVGAGLTGLAAAHLLSEDPRHVITVFETRARFGGRVAEALVADSLDRLACLGVTLRRTAQVERLAVDDVGADLWIHGFAERFELALVATSPADARALLVRSGIRRDLGASKRVYFCERAVDAEASARAALARMAADHAHFRPRPRARETAVRSWARRARGLTASVSYLDLSGHAWPLAAPAVYIANQRWLLDVLARDLMIGRLVTPASYATAAGELEAGHSVAFVVEGELPAHGCAARAASHGRGAALAALAVNAPIVPVAARPGPASSSRFGRPRVRVVIGEPFYPETSSIDGLVDDMCMVVRHLERLASPSALGRACDASP
jgi:NAD(P)-binding Rossmann-like domain